MCCGECVCVRVAWRVSVNDCALRSRGPGSLCAVLWLWFVNVVYVCVQQHFAFNVFSDV